MCKPLHCSRIRAMSCDQSPIFKLNISKKTLISFNKMSSYKGLRKDHSIILSKIWKAAPRNKRMPAKKTIQPRKILFGGRLSFATPPKRGDVIVFFDEKFFSGGLAIIYIPW